MYTDIYSAPSTPIFKGVTQQSEDYLNDTATWTETIITVAATAVAVLFVAFISTIMAMA